MKKLFKPLFALSFAAVLLTTAFAGANANVKSVSASKIEFNSTKELKTALNNVDPIGSGLEWWGLVSSNKYFAFGPGN